MLHAVRTAAVSEVLASQARPAWQVVEVFQVHEETWGAKILKIPLAIHAPIDTNYGMGDTISIKSLTDEQIERISIRRMRQVVGGGVGLVGSTDPNHAELDAGCTCRLCRNGVELDRAGKAVCLRCSRGSKEIDKAIRAVKAEERVLRAVQARRQIDTLKARAIRQMRGGRARRGPTIDPARMAAVKNAVKGDCGK